MKRYTQHTVVLFYTILLAATISCNSNSQPHARNQPEQHKSDRPVLKFKTGVRAILEDSKGNTWFGSYNEGACLLKQGKLIYFTTANGLSDNQVRTIHEDMHGNIWLECGVGLSRYDHVSMSVYSDRNFDTTNRPPLRNTDLWFKSDATMGNTAREKQSGVYQYDGQQLYYYPFKIKDQSGQPIPWGKSTDFVRSKQGRIWFGAYGELIGYDGQQVTVINNQTVGLNGTTENLHIRSLLEDSQGNLWIGNNCGGGRSGIGVIKYDGNTFTLFTKERRLRMEDTQGNSLDKVFSIAEDRSGNIWFGTNESGVWRYDGKSVKNFTREDGVDSGLVWTIYPSKSGKLWFGGGPNGVYEFNGTSFDRIY